MKFGLYNFVQIPVACSPNTYQIMYGDFRLKMSVSAIVTLNTSENIFAVNMQLNLFRVTVAMQLNLFRVTVANASIWSLKSLYIHSFKNFCICWWNFKQIVWSKLQQFWAFWQKKYGFYNHFWQSVNAILEDVSVAEKKKFDAKLLIWRLLSFSVLKVMVFRQPYNQVKSCAKHGRPNQVLQIQTVLK